MNAARVDRVPRDRTRDADKTVRRRVDVRKAFADELPTRPAAIDARGLTQAPESERSYRRQASGGEEVHTLVPLDAVPVLAIDRSDVPWNELGEHAAQLLRRVNGSSSTMSIVTGTSATPSDGARELAALVERGLLRLHAPAVPTVTDDELLLDVEVEVAVG